jgi:hypothetical protein
MQELKIKLQHFGRVELVQRIEECYCAKCGQILLEHELEKYKGKCGDCFYGGVHPYAELD